MAIFHTDTGSIKNLVVSGNLSVSGAASISGTLNVTNGITGSLLGTASWAENFVSASNYLLSSQTSSFVTNSQTSSFVTNSQTASFATTGSNTFNGSQIISGSLTVTQNLTVLGSASVTYISESTLNIETNLITVNTINPGARFGGLAVIDSGSSPLVSASFLYDSIRDEFLFVHKGNGVNVTSSIFLLGPETYDSVGNEIYIAQNRILKSQGNEHVTASNISDNGSIVSIVGALSVTGVITGSISGSVIGYVASSQTSSFITNAQTSSFVTNSQTSSFVTNSQTSSFVQNSQTSSFITTAQTSSFITTAQTSSFVTNSQTSSFVTNSQTSSFVTNTQTSSFVNNNQTASFATTGSNTFEGDQTISGSLTVTSSLSVFGNEFVVNSTGVKLGNVITDVHIVTGSLNVSGSITGSLFGTASFATTSSFTLSSSFATSASISNNSNLLNNTGSSVFATTGSNTFRGAQTINGTLTTTASVSFTGGDVSITTGSTNYLRIFPGGNVFVGPTAVDGGFRLDVNGTTRIQNTFTVAPSTTTEFEVASTGVKIGSVIGDRHSVTGSVGISGSISASFAIISASGAVPSSSILSVFGSGSDYPTFVVRGSQGELFSVTDSLTGSLFSVNNISGLPIFEVFSDSTTKIGIWPVQALYTSTRIIANSSSLFSTVYSVQTASYDGLFADYTIRSGSNARAGQIMTIWNGSETRTTDVATTSFGNTSNFEFTSSVVSGELLLQCRTNSNSWIVKTIIRSI